MWTPRKHSPHYNSTATSLKSYYLSVGVHAFKRFAPNIHPAICMMQQEWRFIGPGYFFQVVKWPNSPALAHNRWLPPLFFRFTVDGPLLLKLILCKFRLSVLCDAPALWCNSGVIFFAIAILLLRTMRFLAFHFSHSP